MITFIIGLVILIVGGAVYGSFCEHVMKPKASARTPAIALRDGVDFVPMDKWRNALIELLNIAGTGPVFGPIQGILFGPIAFLTIPIGCVIGGAVHDYMVSMISMRNKGEQTPALIKRFLGNGTYVIYNIFVCLLLLLIGTVFIYTPGDLFVSKFVGGDISTLTVTVAIVYAVYSPIISPQRFFRLTRLSGASIRFSARYFCLVPSEFFLGCSLKAIR